MPDFAEKFCYGNKICPLRHDVWNSQLVWIRASWSRDEKNPILRTHVYASIRCVCTSLRTVPLTCVLCVHTKGLVPASRARIVSPSVSRRPLRNRKHFRVFTELQSYEWKFERKGMLWDPCRRQVFLKLSLVSSNVHGKENTTRKRKAKSLVYSRLSKRKCINEDRNRESMVGLDQRVNF